MLGYSARLSEATLPKQPVRPVGALADLNLSLRDEPVSARSAALAPATCDRLATVA